MYLGFHLMTDKWNDHNMLESKSMKCTVFKCGVCVWILNHYTIHSSWDAGFQKMNFTYQGFFSLETADILGKMAGWKKDTQEHLTTCRQEIY